MDDSAGTYEVWVMALRRWRDDPTTDMSGLPVLASDTFSPTAYSRLFDHMQAAMSTMMSAWNTRLNKVWTSSPTLHDLSRELIQLRTLLVRRLLLTRHPSLPPEMSGPLYEGACNDIRRIQLDLEKSATTSGARATTDRDASERILDLLRKNSFAAITAPGFPLEELIAAQAAPAGTAMPHQPVPDSTPVRRRVVID
ncbi:MAG: hypothetical protein KF761_13960 [Salinibacterium sp.]|nr:hypothetical protein [Salinibacterium sp.]